MDIFICSLFYTRERQTLYRSSETQWLLLSQADPKARVCFPFFLISSLGKESQEKPGGSSFDTSQEPSAPAPLPTVWRGESAASCWGSPKGQDLQSVYAVCTVCKLIFLLAAIKIKDSAMYCKRYFQF